MNTGPSLLENINHVFLINIEYLDDPANKATSKIQ